MRAKVESSSSFFPGDAVARLEDEVALPAALELDAADPLAERVLPSAAPVAHAHLVAVTEGRVMSRGRWTTRPQWWELYPKGKAGQRRPFFDCRHTHSREGPI